MQKIYINLHSSTSPLIVGYRTYESAHIIYRTVTDMSLNLLSEISEQYTKIIVSYPFMPKPARKVSPITILIFEEKPIPIVAILPIMIDIKKLFLLPNLSEHQLLTKPATK